MTVLPPPFDDAGWYRALTLAERLDLRRREPSAPFSAERGETALARWRTRRPFDDPEVLGRRLADDGATEEEATAAAGTAPETLARLAGGPPEWLVELARCYTGGATGGESRRPEVPERSETALLELVRPLIVSGASRLRRGAEAIRAADPAAPFDPAAVAALFGPPLHARLYWMTLKVLVLELNVARLRGELEGEAPEERFRSFVGRLARRDAATALLLEYPVLARAVVETVDLWVRTRLELLRHLSEDRAALEERFHGGRSLGRLTAVQGDAGDLHRGGRSVQILGTDASVRLVYKPRSLAVDRHFQELLEWLNRRGDQPALRTLEVLDRGDHGWVEFVVAGPCRDAGEVERFYRRQGGYLALLYAIEANDFHFQNLLAAGEHPVPIDLESLFQQRVQAFDRASARGLASETVTYSVLRTGLLPQLGLVRESQDGIDVSALGAEGGQVAAVRRAGPHEAGTDRMRLAPKEARFDGGRNRPSLDGELQSALDWLTAIDEGFAGVYRTLVRYRAELLAPDGPLTAFADDEVRVILRGTSQYQLLLVDSFHPDLVRDALDRDRHLDRLWIGVASRPELAQLAPAERREVEAADVPVFTTVPRTRDLASGSGRVFERFFEQSGLDLVRARLDAMDERDLERQRWMIGASLAALGSAGAPARPGGMLLAGRPAPARKTLIEAARRTARRLEELALVGAGGEASWVGIVALDEQEFAPTPLGIDLYSGLSGIALFLAYLADRTGEDHHAELARAAWRSVEEQLDKHLDAIVEPGVFSGLGGVLHAAGHLYRLWGRPELLDLAERIADRLEVLLEDDPAYDVVGGSAGCILVLLGFARVTGLSRGVRLARRCGDHLLRHARPVDGGLVWAPRGSGRPPLAGLSHGGAGFAWALLELAAETGDPRFRRAALAALEHERTLFVPERGNWRDLRSFHGAEGGFTVAWCNGAAGIGLSRLVALGLVSDSAGREALRREIDHALATTLREGFGPSQCLCHGSLGNLELFTEAARRLGDERWLEPAGRLAAAICDDVLAGSFCCGVPGGFETPGLMDGLAGIGYGLLRLADPERVPSVLLLEPPRAAAKAGATTEPALLAATGGP